MADADVAITAGSGTKIDTRTVGAGTDEHRQVVVVGDPTTAANVGAVSAAGNQAVYSPSVVSTANSSTAVLAGGALFTGTSEDVSNFAAIQINVIASHASATDGLSVQQSSNGTNWDHLDVYTIAATTGKTFSFQPVGQFFRIVYTNGATLQTSFRLQTVFHYFPVKASSQRPSDAYSNETDMEQSWSFTSMWNGTTWDRIPGTTANGVDVDVTRLSALVAGSATIGSIAGITTSVVPGVAATNLGKAEDAVAASGDTGLFTLGVIRATPAINAATGDYGEFAVSPANGQFVAPCPIVVGTVLTPTIDTAAYATGDRVGSVITIPAALASGRAGQLVGATLVDKAKQKATLELWIFKASPTLVGADNAAFDITDANLLTAAFVGIIDFTAASYADTSSNSVCVGTVRGTPGGNYVTSGSANLFGVFVSRGTPTYASTTDLVLDIEVTQF